MTAADWARYRQCPVCKAPLGQPCTETTGAVVEGAGYVRDAIVLRRDTPHTTRKLRTGYGR